MGNRKNACFIIIVLLILNITFISSVSNNIKADATYVTILRPIISVPVIQERGKSFIVEVNSDATSNSDWNAMITTKYDSFSLIVNDVTSDSTSWRLNVTIPSIVREDLYDLTISVDGITDIEPHAVSVINQLKNEFSFIQMTDIHIQDSPSTNENYVKQAIMEANLIHPEFVIITGDIGDNPEGVAQDEVAEYQRVYDLLLMFQVPVYVINGNHDYDSDTGEQSPINVYRQMINPYPNFSFDYGQYHFVGLDSGEKTAYYGLPGCMMGTGLTNEQIAWLKNDLTVHSNSKQTFIFMHHTALDPDGTTAWEFYWNSSISQNQQEFINITNQYNVTMVLTGHTHEDEVWDKNGQKYVGGTIGKPSLPLYIQTRATGKNDKALPGYRLIRVKDSELESYTYDWDGNGVRDADKSIPSGHLTATYFQPNDGTSRSLTARIVNELRENIDNVFLIFIMPTFEGEYEPIITNGSIDQKMEFSNYDIYYVRTELPMLTVKDVTVIQNLLPIASFTYSPSTPITTDTMQFADTSIDSDGIITSWLWEFGDGISSSDKDAMHKYRRSGAYTVKLVVMDNDGEIGMSAQEISIGNSPPIANFTYSPTNLTAKETIQFVDFSKDSDGTIISWSWDFGDGCTVTTKNPTHKFLEGGNYTVRLTVTDDEGANDTMPIIIAVKQQSTILSPIFYTILISAFLATITGITLLRVWKRKRG